MSETPNPFGTPEGAGATPPSTPPQTAGTAPVTTTRTYEWNATTQGAAGKATASLVLGIAGVFICPLVCSIPAIVLGSQARGEIERTPGLGGAGMARVGIVLGWVGVAVGIVIAIVVGLTIWGVGEALDEIQTAP